MHIYHNTDFYKNLIVAVCILQNSLCAHFFCRRDIFKGRENKYIIYVHISNFCFVWYIIKVYTRYNDVTITIAQMILTIRTKIFIQLRFEAYWNMLQLFLQPKNKTDQASRVNRTQRLNTIIMCSTYVRYKIINYYSVYIYVYKSKFFCTTDMYTDTHILT